MTMLLVSRRIWQSRGTPNLGTRNYSVHDLPGTRPGTSRHDVGYHRALVGAREGWYTGRVTSVFDELYHPRR